MKTPISPNEARVILHSADEICSAKLVTDTVARMADDINATLKNTNPLVLCAMRGSLVFAGQLLPRLNFPLEVDTLDVTRYANSTRGAGITFRHWPAAEVRGRTVLLLDDILDEGVTLTAIREKLLMEGATRVCIGVFAVKDVPRKTAVHVDFAGVTLPNRYVFGFGMDVYGYWRNLPAIYALKDS